MSFSFPDLEGVNSLLSPVERELVKNHRKPKHPVLFVIGTGPRCGHTLFSQLLASTGRLWTASNFIARFWEAPTLGTLLRRALGAEPRYSFNSELGKTSELDDPHEFGKFLQRWLPLKDDHVCRLESVSPEAVASFQREMAALEDASGLPVFLRNLAYGMNLGLVRDLAPNAVFAACSRNPVFQVQSILLARERSGAPDNWWSLRPPGYAKQAKRSPEDQAAWQVKTISDLMQRGLEAPGLDGKSATRAEVDYGAVCKNPASLVRETLELVFDGGAPLDLDLPNSFKSSDVRRFSRERFARVERAVADAGF